MPPNYASVDAKLKRAEEHLELLDEEIAAWLQLCNDTYTVERGAYETRIGLVVHMHGPTGDFLRWTLMVGDCINNARSALDHLVYAIGEFECPKGAPRDFEKNQFVIADSPTAFTGEAKGRLKGLSSPVVAAIESVQPFNRIHPLLPPTLRLLRKFSNADKHRLLQLANAGIATTDVRFIGDRTKGAKMIYVVPEPVKNNDIICVVESAQADPQLAFHGVNIGMEVCIWHELRDGDTNPMHSRTGYRPLLREILSEVRYAIETVKLSVV